MDKRIKFYSQNTNLLPPKPKSSFRHLKQGIQEFHKKYVLVPADKATNNVVVVCRLHYINPLKQELNGTKAYIKYCETVYERSGKNMFWPIKNYGKVLSKLKYIGYQATSLSTYDFSTLYTTLPHNLIKEKLLDLIERTFYKTEGELYLACNDKKAFFTSKDHYKIIKFGLVRMYVTPYRFSWTIFILGLALSKTDKLLVFRWVQIVLHL